MGSQGGGIKSLNYGLKHSNEFFRFNDQITGFSINSPNFNRIASNLVSGTPQILHFTPSMYT